MREAASRRDDACHGRPIWRGSVLTRRALFRPAVPPGSLPGHRIRKGLRVTVVARIPSSTIPLAGSPKRSRSIDGSDFLPYPNYGSSDHNVGVPVGLGRRPGTMAGAAQNEGASRLRIRNSPQSEEERGVRLALRRHPYWVGQKGFEGFMSLTRWSEGVPDRGGREESHSYLTDPPTTALSAPRSQKGPGRRSRSRNCHRVTTTTR
jgi:hypothetical protein